MTIIKASKELEIKIATAKSILRAYKKHGKIL
jgi:hypothetical protein